MDIKRLQALVVDALEDVKAQEIAVFDTMHLTALFDRLAIASGTSNRQTKALAASVRDKVKSHGGQVISMEGEDTGEWVLVDLGDMIVHIMQPAIRAYYRLEEIWGDKPIKLADAKRGLKADGDGEAKPRRRTASKSVEAEAPAPRRARKTAAASADEAPAPRRATTTGVKAPAKTTTKTTTKTATKTAAKAGAKTAGVKTAGVKTTGARTAGAKTAGAKTAAPRKTAVKTPAGKTVKVAASKSANAKPARKAAASR